MPMPGRRVTNRPLELAQHGEQLCSLYRRLDEGTAQVEQTFAALAIHDLRAEPSESVRLGLPRDAQDASPANEQDESAR